MKNTKMSLSEQNAYYFGQDKYFENGPISDNPYSNNPELTNFNPRLYAAWESGYLTAKQIMENNHE